MPVQEQNSTQQTGKPKVKGQDVAAQPTAAQEPGAKRTESFAFGIPQAGLTQVEREVPADEPPPLAPNAQLRVIGQPPVRYAARKR